MSALFAEITKWLSARSSRTIERTKTPIHVLRETSPSTDRKRVSASRTSSWGNSADFSRGAEPAVHAAVVFREYAQDTWKVRPTLTVNAGVDGNRTFPLSTRKAPTTISATTDSSKAYTALLSKTHRQVFITTETPGSQRRRESISSGSISDHTSGSHGRQRRWPNVRSSFLRDGV